MHAEARQARVCFVCVDTNMDWLALLLEKAAYTPSFSINVVMRSAHITLYNGPALCHGKRRGMCQRFLFPDCKHIVCLFLCASEGHGEKAGVALAATELVIQEGKAHSTQSTTLSLGTI